jgi:hypothetical protein
MAVAAAARRLDRMQDTVRFDDSKRLAKRQAGMEPPPFARVPHPIDIEAALSRAIDTGEARVELFAAIVLHARPVALHETISPRRPGTMDVDHVIPFGRSDLRQEARLQDVANEALASRDDRPLFHLVRRHRPGRSSCRYPLFLSSHILDPCLPILIRHACGNTLAPQHFLYFFPLPQGQESLRPTFSDCIGMGGFKAISR